MTALKTRTLGKSGIEVTEIGMGLWAAGGDQWGPTDDQAVLDAIDSALAVGITFFDTADVYGSGHSEDRYPSRSRVWSQPGSGHLMPFRL